jgi:hypothetical protein
MTSIAASGGAPPPLEGDPLGERLHETGDANLVDYLGKLPSAGLAHSTARARISRQLPFRLGRSRFHRPRTHPEPAAFRPRLATGDRRIDEAKAASRAFRCTSRASAAEPVVWSTNTAPGGIPAKAPLSPSEIARASSSLPTQGEHEVARLCGCARCRRARPAIGFDPASSG